MNQRSKLARLDGVSTSVNAYHRIGSRSPVLFLDFDGVLHPMPYFPDEMFCRLRLVEAVILSFPDLRVVISSDWRKSRSLIQLHEVFCREMWPQVIDVNPRWDAYRDLHGLTTYSRQWECEKWLVQNGLAPRTLSDKGPVAASWLAIDDMREWFEPDCPNLLWTNTKTGFTEDNAADLRARLTQMTLKKD